jgi:amidase
MSRTQRNSPGPFQPDRRTFLAGGLAAGLSASTLSAAVRAGQEAVAQPSRAGVAPFELDELTVADLQRGIEAGQYTARSLAEIYLARIEAIDRRGPSLRAVIEVNPDALAIADDLDRERRAKGPRGPLHGIPVLVKDNFDSADKMETTAGSLALVGSKPIDDSYVVKQLRGAGAVLLGKTNLTEWANIRGRNSIGGWSGRGGLTRNPYALDRNPSGSSSGSAVAVAANLCAVAVGTETDGSVLCPASVCGIVGIKPTVGLVSRTGVVPISHTQDTPGPMARTVRDAAILLGALAGIDPQDPATAESKGHSSSDYTRNLDAAGLKGATIGVARNFFGFREAVDVVMAAALDALTNGGATLVETKELESVDAAGSAGSLVLRYELKADMAAYLAHRGPNAPVKNLKDIIDFNNRHHDQELQYFGQETFLAANEKGPLTDKEYLDALAKCRRLSRTEGIDAVMDKHKLDAIVAPTTGPACVTDLLNGNRVLGGSTSPAAMAGYPSISVPAGFVFGLPVGISFFGRAWSEPILLKLAYAFEQATRHRKPPQFLPTAVFDA